MNDWLSERAAISPAHPALIFRDEEISYGELDARVSRVCGELAARGVQAGQFVAAHMPNGPVLVTLVHALVRLGAIIVPINLRLTRGEISFQLEQANVDWLIYVEGSSPEVIGLLPEGRLIPMAKTVRGGSDPQWSSRPLDLSAPWGVIFTSGTTGKPKGALLTYHNLHASALASAERLGSFPDDRWLLAMPLFHIGGLSILVRCCLYGIAVHLVERFDVEEVNSILDDGAVNMVSLVPTMLQRLMQARRWQPFPESLRLILLGGAAAPPGFLEKCVEAGLPIACTYGLSEAASQVATATVEETRRKPGTAGKPLRLTGLRIATECGKNADSGGEIGEIWVNGPTVMLGYLGEDGVPDDGWLNTGDLGYLDEDGDLWVVQRRADLIVTGGENVYPAEVEAALLSHPAVLETCVVGVPDEEWGQVVGVAVVLIEDRRSKIEHQLDESRISTPELSDFLRERLAAYKVPKRWLFVDELPQTESGKVKRNDVQIMFTAEKA